MKIAGSISISSSHPRFAALKASMGSNATNYVAVPPTHPEFAALSAEKGAGAANGQANGAANGQANGAANGQANGAAPELTREQKREKIKEVLMALTEVNAANGIHEAAKRAVNEAAGKVLKANDAFAVAMRGFAGVVPVGQQFVFGGNLYTHLSGRVFLVNDEALDFDVEPAPEAPQAEASPAEQKAPEAAPAEQKAPEAAPAEQKAAKPPKQGAAARA